MSLIQHNDVPEGLPRSKKPHPSAGTWQPLPLPFCCCTSASCLGIAWSVAVSEQHCQCQCEICQPVCPFRVRDAGWPYPCHCFNTPVPPASTLPSLFRRSLQQRLQSLRVLKCGMCQPEVGVHSESPGPRAGASGPVSVLGYFNLHVWHQLFYQYTEYRNKKLRRINSEHSIVHH